MLNSSSHDWLQTLLLLGERLEKFKPAIQAAEQKMPGIFGIGLEDEKIWLEIKRVAENKNSRDYRSFLDFLENGIPPAGDGWVERIFRQMARNRLRVIIGGLPVTKEKLPQKGKKKGEGPEVTNVDHRVEVILWIGRRAREDGYNETVRQLASGNIIKKDPFMARLLSQWVNTFQNWSGVQRTFPELLQFVKGFSEKNLKKLGKFISSGAEKYATSAEMLPHPPKMAWIILALGFGLVGILFTIAIVPR